MFGIDYNITESLGRHNFINIDSDGDLDIITCNNVVSSIISVSAFYNDGFGNFAQSAVLWQGTSQANKKVEDFEFLDINNNNLKDFVIVTNTTYGFAGVLTN